MASKTTENIEKADQTVTFAVIATGGKQYKVTKGDIIEVERLNGDSHTFTPVLLVNRGKVRATTKDLDGATVTAKVVGESKGPKITGFKYKPKSNSRTRWGHRQHLVRIEITDIKVGSAGGTKAAEAKKQAAPAEAKKKAEPAEAKKQAEPTEATAATENQE